MYGTLLGDNLYLHEKPLKSYCQHNSQHNIHCFSTSKWYFKILVILLDKGDINISSPLPQSASGKKRTQIKIGKKKSAGCISPPSPLADFPAVWLGLCKERRRSSERPGWAAVSKMLS